jgi:hypothetical protein
VVADEPHAVRANAAVKATAAFKNFFIKFPPSIFYHSAG